MSKKTTIEVRIDRDERSFNTNEVRRNVMLMKMLRERGVPVIGAISVISVEHGQLSTHREEDLDGDVFVYRWTGDESHLRIPCPPCTCETPLKPIPSSIDDDEL
jgi:hypothetical protein